MSRSTWVLKKWEWAIAGVAVVLLVVMGTAIATRENPKPSENTTSYAPATGVQAYSMPPVLAVIGDSYTGGSDMGGRGPNNWLPVMAKDIGYLDCGFAIGGSGWTRGRAGMTFGARVDWALDLDPDVVMFVNGVNDLKAEADAAGASARAALADLRSKNPAVAVVVVGPILVSDSSTGKTRRMADGIKAATLEYGAKFIDPMAEGWFSGENRKLIGSDNFHPTDAGMIYLAGKVKESMRKLGLADLPYHTREKGTCSIPEVLPEDDPELSPATTSPSATPTPRP